MIGLWRSLRGELYLLRHRRSVLWMHVGVFLLAALYVAGARIKLEIVKAAGGGGIGEVAAWNFWPQFGDGTRAGLFLVEIATLIFLAGGLPREISSGAVRDPLARRISRSAFAVSRCVVAIILPLTLFVCAIAGSAGCSALLFDAGDIMSGGEVLFGIEEEGIDLLLYKSMAHAILPLLALAMFSVWMSTAFRHGVAGVGVGLAVMLAPSLLHETMGEKAPWLFSDVLPAMGQDSFLKEANERAAGNADAYPYSFDEIVQIGWISPLPAVALSLVFALLMFRRKQV